MRNERDLENSPPPPPEDEHRNTRANPDELTPQQARKKMEGTPAWQKAEEIKADYDDPNYENYLWFGETGSGKTTIVDALKLGRGIMTQPKKNITREIAGYMNKIASTENRKVGYAYRGAGHGGGEFLKNNLTLATEGTLEQYISENTLLEGIDFVALDEIHGMSEDMIALATMLVDIQKQRREAKMSPLKIIGMTATPDDIDELMKFFHPCKKVEIEGRMYPVTPHYLDDPDEEAPEKPLDDDISPQDMPEKAAEVLFEKILMHKKRESETGNVLIFMPGKGEIKATEKAIGVRFEAKLDSLSVQLGRGAAIAQLHEAGLCTLEGKFALDIRQYHGQMSADTLKEINASPTRQIIIATDAAETGITFEKLQFVIDSGLVKQIEFNPVTGIERLERKEAAKAALKQREGRAGRLAAGEYFGLFTHRSYDRRDKARTSEIERSDPMAFVLRMKQYGINTFDENVKLLKRPLKENLDYAIRMLKNWGVLNENEMITKPFGEQVAQLGVEPRLAYLVAKAIDNGCVQQACQIAAFLTATKAKPLIPSGPNEVNFTKAYGADATSDFHTILKFWKDYEENKNNNNWEFGKVANWSTLKDMDETNRSLLESLKNMGIAANDSTDTAQINKTLTQAYFDRLFTKDRETGKYISLNGKVSGIQINSENSVLAKSAPNIVIIADLSDRNEASMIQPVDRKDIETIAPEKVTHTDHVPQYESNTGMVVQVREFFLQEKDKKYSIDAYEDISEAIPQEVKIAIFAQALASNEVALSIAARNIQTMIYINNVWNRAGAISDEHFKPSDLTEFYKNLLNTAGISSKMELEKALQHDAEAWTLNPEKFLPPNFPQPPSAPPPSSTPTPPRQENGDGNPGGILMKVRDVGNRIVGFFKNLFRQPPIPQT